MADQAGVEVYKRFYPWPDSFRLGDPVLVKEVTGMSWPDFTTALDDQNQAIAEAEEMGGDPPQADQVVLAGLIAVAFWQGNPHMSRDKARRALERIPMDDIEMIDGDEEVDVGPPEQEAAGEPPLTTSNESAASQEVEERTEIHLAAISDETSPNGSGELGLPSAPLESHPA